MLAQLLHRVYKIRTVGPRAAVRVWQLRRRSNGAAALWRKHTNWLYLVPPAHRSLLQDHCASLYDQIITQPFSCMGSVYLAESHAQTITVADRYVRREITIFGSVPQRFEKIPWHTDVRLFSEDRCADVSFDPNTFFADYIIPVAVSDTGAKDIKAVWELSRFEYLPVLCRAHQYTQDQRYADAFVGWIDDWITQNRFLHGPNWVNAMEVAIRALNWIAAFEYLKADQGLTIEFKKRFIQSLYQHMLYIEHNWEYYDSRTNNHYLTNLVGYLYLTHFFSALPGCDAKFAWCISELLYEFDKQIFDEGTSYEGSTHYHLLVTELFYLAYVLLQQLHMLIDPTMVEKLQRMISFLVWCTPHRGALIKIGDDDSGSILRGGISYEKLAAILQMSCDDAGQIGSFAQFGLSIIKTRMWHVTLRHHSYGPHQPTGHFHNDAGSMTLAYNGLPILVDPGSYLYTASALWRNQFRSTFVHNSCFIKDQELVGFDQDLFSLMVPPAQSGVSTFQDPTTLGITSQHTLYKRYGVLFERTVNLNIETSELTISDTCKSRIKQQHHTIGWNFLFAPQIQLQQESSGIWIVSYQEKPIMSISSPQLKFTLEPGFVAPSYGVKIPTHRLCASTGMKIDVPLIITMKACIS